MKLKPYPLETERWRKVCKHVFHPAERWWEVLGEEERWWASRDTLRTVGCLDGPTGHLKAAVKPSARAVLGAYHSEWLGAAEAACDQAISSQQVYDQEQKRRVLVGRLGVLVVVEKADQMVTCFRPTPCPHDPEAAERTAVRRATYRASLPARARRSGDRPGVQR